jgi:hypothetical protein
MDVNAFRCRAKARLAWQFSNYYPRQLFINIVDKWLSMTESPAAHLSFRDEAFPSGIGSTPRHRKIGSYIAHFLALALR